MELKEMSLADLKALKKMTNATLKEIKVRLKDVQEQKKAIKEELKNREVAKPGEPTPA